MTTELLASPGEEWERYRMVRPLGRGAQGEVWLATHADLDTHHAVKILLDPRPGLEERLRLEGKLQAAASHRHLVRVTDTLLVRGRPALVMEHVDGPSLAELLRRGRPSIADVDQIAVGILRGVAHAHERGWVHRDIKPSNTLLARDAEGWVPKIADFGLAKVLGPRTPADPPGTSSLHGAGTPRYMALEQALGAAPDPRMDVYSLGAVLYELLTGRPAFETVDAWARALREGDVPKPVRRGATQAMLSAISVALGPVEARPPDAGALLARWTDRSVAPRRGSAWLLVLGAGLAAVASLPSRAPSPARAPPSPVAVPPAEAPAPAAREERAEPPPPSPPPPPPPAPRRPGRLAVVTIHGEPGTYSVDGGAPQMVGGNRKHVAAAGPHDLVVRDAAGSPVFSDTVQIREGRELVVCWDLAAGRLCEAPYDRPIPTP